MESSLQSLTCGYSAVPIVGQESSYNNRARFVVFLKKLLDRLRSSGEVILLEQAKLTVHHCTYRNRLGDPNFTPLVETTECRLRALVGEMWWELAQAETTLYFANRESLIKRSQPLGIALRP